MKKDTCNFAVTPAEIIESSVRKRAYDYFVRHGIKAQHISLGKIEFCYAGNGVLHYSTEIAYDETKVAKILLDNVGVGPDA